MISSIYVSGIYVRRMDGTAQSADMQTIHARNSTNRAHTYVRGIVVISSCVISWLYSYSDTLQKRRPWLTEKRSRTIYIRDTYFSTPHTSCFVPMRTCATLRASTYWALLLDRFAPVGLCSTYWRIHASFSSICGLPESVRFAHVGLRLCDRRNEWTIPRMLRGA